MKWLALIVLLFALPASAQCNPPCPMSRVGCCSELFHRGGASSPPAGFAQGCYTGNDSDHRQIPTGIDNPGLVMLYKVDPDADSGDATFRTDTSGPGDAACIMVGACDTANRIEALANQYFQIGTDDSVNTNGDHYCWFTWSLGEHFYTFTYTGDGAGNRTLALPAGFTPAFAAIKLGDGGCFGANRIYMRSDDMPTNVSYGWYNVGEAPRTNVIRGLGSATLDVGACANELGILYRAWAWESSPDYGDAVPWTGNGNAASNCATAAQQQAISPGGAPKNIITVGCQGNNTSCGAQGLNCIAQSHTGVSPVIRGLNMGVDVTGPGHTSDDFISIFGPGGLQHDVLGQLTSTTFTVAGDGSFSQNLNDIGLLPYSWVTFTAGAVPGTTALADWCFDTSTVACYKNTPDDPGGIDFPFGANNDCSTGALSGGTFLCGNTTCDCNLAQDGVTADTVNKVIGQQSAAYVAADNAFMSCAAATCSTEFLLGQSGASFTIGGHFRATLDADMTFVNKNGTTTGVYSASRAAAGDIFDCGVKNTSGTLITDGVAGFTLSDFHYGECVFDNPGNTVTAYFDGAASGSPSAIATDAQGGSGDFSLGSNGTIGAVTGNTNMVFITTKAVTALDSCRACSCGWSGQGCQCWDVDATQYIDTGVNSTICNSCTLPACNKLAPS